MEKNLKLREFIKESFHSDIKSSYVPDQNFINYLLNALDKVEANSFEDSDFYLKKESEDYLKIHPKKTLTSFITGCLNQLLWINSMLESGASASSEDDLFEHFNYHTPQIEGNNWVLFKVKPQTSYFHIDGIYIDSRIIINSENILDIAKSLLKIFKLSSNECKPKTSSKPSVLFNSLETETKCLNILKSLEFPVLDSQGNFLGKSGMKGAIVFWFDQCKKLGFIKVSVLKNREDIAQAVMNVIPNLSIDGSTFDKNPKAKKYRSEIMQKLSQLSQNSK